MDSMELFKNASVAITSMLSGSLICFSFPVYSVRVSYSKVIVLLFSESSLTLGMLDLTVGVEAVVFLHFSLQP